MSSTPVRPGRPSKAALLTLAALALCARAWGDDGSSAATARLAEAMGDPARADITLAALRTVGDEELATVFIAASRSSNKSRRMLATASLRDFSGPVAAQALLNRVRSDVSMAVRAEALLALVAANAATDEQLIEALAINDDAVRCIAARELVRRKRTDLAAAALSALAASQDPAAAAIARLTLLASGDKRHLAGLAETIADPSTPESLLAILLEQIAEDKIAPAAELARRLAGSERSAAIRLLAWKAACAAAPDAAAALREEIARQDSISLGVRLLAILAECDSAERHLKALTGRSGAVAALARFELARNADELTAAEAARQVAELGHPVVIDYLLESASADVAAKGRKAEFYVPALLACIRLAREDSPIMTAEHIRAARASTALADIGTSEALAGLRNILGERYNCRVRAVAAGLMKTKNRAACALAAPLLKSPYEELATGAALALGRFSDPAATKYLKLIVEQSDRHSPTLVALASWYLLKSTGKTRQAVSTVAASVE